jgi:S1-C subfamily serine protease
MPASRRIAALLISALAIAACGSDGGGTNAATSAVIGTPSTTHQGAGLEQVPGLYRQTQPSVVSVLVRKDGAQGEGSGVVWDAHTVVTNNHVVEGASTVELALASGERLDARVGPRDPRTDLAIIEVPDRALPPATFAKSLPTVGELVIALGAPLGFENTVTAGIVSGVERSIPSGGQAPGLVGLIQTDAPISPGNSGGALVDGRGRVVGLNVAFIPPQARAVSIGFAIPAPLVRDVVRQLLENGEVEHPYLGVDLRPLTSEIARRLKVATDRGAVVVDVQDGSAAAKAGPRPGDVIVSVDGAQVSAVEDVLAALRDNRPGDRVGIVAIRDGERRELTTKLGSRPSG